ncbi:calcipressin-3-like isoform X2 [Babylonia areolata]|uniref:calcipressin-3-like isoform X2 n=1 Tax=Babylonia areolata TaxID=304850 RepID=UPI003FD5B010
MIIETKKMAEDDSDDFSSEEIANAIIVTNLSLEFFEDEAAKEEFKAAFRNQDPEATFNFLKSFRRARVNFSSTEATVATRLERHNTQLCGQDIKCYFARVPKMSEGGLLPPKPEKMFLISPPSSPPVGWEQHLESGPVINYELLEALSNLNPGDVHEVQPASENSPGIVVQLCEDPEGYANRPTILQTRRPEPLN